MRRVPWDVLYRRLAIISPGALAARAGPASFHHVLRTFAILRHGLRLRTHLTLPRADAGSREASRANRTVIWPPRRIMAPRLRRLFHGNSSTNQDRDSVPVSCILRYFAYCFSLQLRGRHLLPFREFHRGGSNMGAACGTAARQECLRQVHGHLYRIKIAHVGLDYDPGHARLRAACSKCFRR